MARAFTVRETSARLGIERRCLHFGKAADYQNLNHVSHIMLSHNVLHTLRRWPATTGTAFAQTIWNARKKEQVNCRSMKNVYCTLGLALAATLLSQSDASANSAIASTTYGGATYYLYAGNLPWTVAESDAVSDGGTLAVLTSAAQTTAVYDGLIGNGFFTANAGQQYEAWLGATPADGSHSTTNPGNWAWVTGAPWTAFDEVNFGNGEPNGDSEGLAINRYGAPTWNDEGGYVGGYIVEVQGVPDAGSTQFLLAGACAVIGVASRKFRKQ